MSRRLDNSSGSGLGSSQPRQSRQSVSYPRQFNSQAEHGFPIDHKLMQTADSLSALPWLLMADS